LLIVKEYKPKNLVLDLPNGVKLELVDIPAGSFMMGSDEYNSEQPIHQVTLKAFKMGKYPITQKQYLAVMGKNPSNFKRDKNLPVVEKSWDNAIAFCKKLSEMTRQNVKLPSESQWEYACRAGGTGKYCFGDDVEQLGNYAWYTNNSGDKYLDALQIPKTDQDNYWKRLDYNKLKLHPVGEKLANPWGLHNMHGNVWEWCDDVWHENYNSAPNDGTAWLKDDEQNRRAMRGGSYNDDAIIIRSSFRTNSPADERCINHSFRVVV
jgi:formylglycine-generating enzyme required for sulfatase activity